MHDRSFLHSEVQSLKIGEKVNLAIAVIALLLSVEASLHGYLADRHKHIVEIKNGYSLGQVVAGRVGVRSVYQGNENDPKLLSALNQLDYLAQEYAQNLSIDPKRMLEFLNSISADQNLLTSSAKQTLEKEISSNGLDEDVSVAYDLGWSSSAYSQYCVLAARFIDRDPSIAASFTAAYPAMIETINGSLKKLGHGSFNPRGNLSLPDTCKELSGLVTNLNQTYQNQ
jgi:hypothetical protein